MDPVKKNNQSYPLSALFLLVAACAVVCALLTPLGRAMVSGHVGGDDTAIASVCGAFLSMMLGALIGLYHYRPFRGLAWGLLTGGVIGMFVGPVILAPPESMSSLLAISLGGAIVLVLTGAFFRLTMGDKEAPVK